MPAKKKQLAFVSLVTIGLLVTLAPFLPSIFPAAASSSQGYVTYSVTLTNGTQSNSFNATESVSPSSSQGLSMLNLTLSGETTKFSLAKLINSSSVFFPDLNPVLANQSISYQNSSISASFSLQKNGTSSVIFNGSKYQLNDYSFNATVSSTKYSVSKSLKGEISAFPSTLIYSVDAEYNQTNLLSVRLLSTNLSLIAPDPSPLGSPLAMDALVVGGILALAVGGVFIAMKLRARKPALSSAEKPSYWVD
jgi:hypothetical protein